MYKADETKLAVTCPMKDNSKNYVTENGDSVVSDSLLENCKNKGLIDVAAETNTSVTQSLFSDDDEINDQDMEGVEDEMETEGCTPINEAEETTAQPVRYFTKRCLKYQIPSSSMEPLPEGWVTVQHNSGIPVYLHKKTKVLTWSRPYVIGVGSVRKHSPPIVSIPCLAYMKTLEKIELEVSEQTKGDPSNNDTDKTKCDENKNEAITPKENGNSADDQASFESQSHNNQQESSSIDNVNGNENKTKAVNTEQNGNSAEAFFPKAILHSNQNELLDETSLLDYINLRFKFNVTQVPHFNKWSDKRQFARNKKREANQSTQESQVEPKKLGPAKVITVTIPREEGSNRPQKVAFNPSTKPMVCVLHEYAQSVLRTKPHFIFRTNDDSSEPFQATIVINEKTYGVASGLNKKTAKNKAALATMEMLVPGFKDQVESLSGETSVEYFNDVSVTDQRVYDLCVHAGNYLPYQLLTECLKRNQGIADTSIKFDVQAGKGKNIDFTMVCGKHVVNGSAKNKKIGKQHAAQQVLQLLHPKVTSWGELIKAYGTSVAEKRARKKNMEQEIFELKQRRSAANAADARLVEDTDTSQEKGGASSGISSPGVSRGRDQKETPGPNPELLAKLRKMMEELGEKRRIPANGETPSEEEPDAKRSKLLEIDV